MFCSNHRIFGHEGEEAQDVLYVNWLNMVRAGLTGLEYYTPETGRWRQVNTLLLEKMCIITHNHQRHRKFELSEKYKGVIKINIQYLLQLYIAQKSPIIIIYMSEYKSSTQCCYNTAKQSMHTIGCCN